jgi:hypothetical protein
VGIHGGDALMNKAVFLDHDGNRAVVRNGKPYIRRRRSGTEAGPARGRGAE